MISNSSLPRRPHHILRQETFASTTTSPIVFGSKFKPHPTPSFPVHKAVDDRQVIHEHQVIHDQPVFNDQNHLVLHDQPVFHDQPVLHDQPVFHDLPILHDHPIFQDHPHSPTPEPLVHHRGTVLPPVISTTPLPILTTSAEDLLVRTNYTIRTKK